MDKDKVLQQGTVGKWRITIDRDDFDMSTDDFSVVLTCGIYPAKSVTIAKADMEVDAAGYYITFDSDDVHGKITATCTFTVADSDDNSRQIVDKQMIGFVTSSSCPQFQDCCSCEETNGVSYAAITQEGYTIYYGAGDAYTDAASKATVKSSAAGTYTINVAEDASTIYFLVPSFMTITSASMSGFTMPFETPTEVTIDNITYLCYASSNTYDAGTITIVIS